MGTHKGSDAKKATNSAAIKRKLSTKVKIADPVLRPKRPCRRPGFAKAWEEWEDTIVLEFREEGKTHAQISQHLSRRSYDACRTRYSILKARTQKTRTQQKDALVFSVPKQPNLVKDWEDWEDNIILGFRKEGKNYAQISQHLSHRSYGACRNRCWILKARSQEARTQKIDALVFSVSKRPNSGKGWEDWEDQILVAHRTAGWTWKNIRRLLPHRSVESVSRRTRTKKLSLIFRPQEIVTPRTRPAKTSSIPGMAKVPDPWIQEEDQVLRSLRESGFSFAEIAEKVPNRSPGACRHRWHLIRQDQGPRRTKGRCWEEWEERLIVSGYYAGLSWEEISKSMTGRTAKGCAQQWSTFFRSTDPDEPWTAEDLALLVNLRSQGSSWDDISEEFPQYSCNACRTHWYKETEGIQGPFLDYHRGSGDAWSAGEVITLVALYNTIGPRYEEICKHLPGRTAVACGQYLRAKSTKKDGLGGPPSAFWEEYFANEREAGGVGSDSKEAISDESVSEEVPTPRLRHNQQPGVDARKRKVMDIPMV